MNKKNLIIFMAFAVIFGSSTAIATIGKNVTEQVNDENLKTTRKFQLQETVNENSEIITQKDLEDLRSCKPMTESDSGEFLGVNFSYNFKIEGWQNDKCRYEFFGKINKLSKDFRKSFDIKISDSQISKFEPKVHCEFNQEQLDVLVDVIDEEISRTKDVLAQQNESEFLVHSTSKELTPKEEKLVNVFTEQNVCTIVNMEELMTQMDKFH